MYKVQSQPVVSEVGQLGKKNQEKALRLFQQILEKESLTHSTLAREYREMLVQNRILKGSSVNIEDLVMVHDKDVRIKNVILSRQNRNIIALLEKEHAAKSKLLTAGLFPISTILFEGASGTGKTYLGQALGNELGYRMLYIDNGRAYTPGQMLRSIDAIFTEIREAEGGICVFMDEIEVVAWNRASKNATDESKAALTSLFQNIDQLKRDRLDFLLIFSTNLKQQLDDAFIRRCEIQMLFTVPDDSVAASIKHFVNMSEVEGVPSQFRLDLEGSVHNGKRIDLEDTATKHSLKPILNSYDAIRKAVQRAKKMCIMEGRFNVTLNDIIIAAKFISSSDGSQLSSADVGLTKIEGGKPKVFSIDSIKENDYMEGVRDRPKEKTKSNKIEKERKQAGGTSFIRAKATGARVAVPITNKSSHGIKNNIENTKTNNKDMLEIEDLELDIDIES
jgi:SpoVK/Ycf46/Vps4 family AAA+-type ATPase